MNGTEGQGYYSPVVPADLRRCSFCANAHLTVAAVGHGDKVERIAVVCTECGAFGPMASADDPPGHAEFLWNQRYGVDH